MKFAVAALVLAASLGSNVAHGQLVDGKALVDDMREFDKAERDDPNTKWPSAGFFNGYVAAVHDITAGFTTCAPPGVTLGQISVVVSKYLKEHPEEWHKTAHWIIHSALKQAFPCKKESSAPH